MKRLACLLLIALVGCGSSAPPVPVAPSKPPERPSGAKATPGVALIKPVALGTQESALAEARKRELKNEDFTESESNRDPFRSFLPLFAAQPPVLGKQHKAILQKFALDALKLVAVVGGEGVPSRAMFVEPAGTGGTVVKGDHLAKVDATVVRIAPDRVFLQIEEDAGGGKIRLVDKVIELHARKGVGP